MKKFLVAITLFLIAALPALAQSVPLGPRFVLPYQTVVDGTGTPIPGALLYFYSSGTNIPLTTYSNPLLTTPNSNPVQANAAGVFPAIFLSGNYKIVLTDASNNQIWAADPVYGVGNGGGGGQCLSITVNPQTGTSYTLQPSDNCKLVTFNNSSAIAVSLPSPATNASYQTWSATVSDIGTGTITVTPTGASFTGTGSGTNLTVTGVTGTIASRFLVTGTGVPASTTIVSQSSGTPGGAGVYVTSQATTSSGASLTAAAAINGAATLTVLPGQAAQIISDGSNYQVILSSPAGSSISVGSTVVLNGTAGRILYQNGAVIGQYPTTGTAGSVVLSTSPTIVGPTITGSLTATGLVTNADLVNPSVTVNGTACVLGASCTISSSASAVTVSGGSATTILGGSGAGHVILDNAGVLGEVSSTVTVNGTACVLGASCTISSSASAVTVSGGSATTILGGSGAGHVILDNAGVLGEVSSTVTVNGTACVLGASCTISSSASAVTVSGGSATTILGGSGAGHVILDNAGVLGEVSSTVTVNGTACVLGASCTISSSASAVTVSGGSATTILGGSGAGHVILDNAGVLGEVSSTVTVNGTACTLGSTCAPSTTATNITVGTTTVVSGSANALLAQSTSGATVAEITTGNNQTLITNGSGVSSFSATLPTAVQGNITSTGTLTGGATGAGFTIALSTSTVTGFVSYANIAQLSASSLLGNPTGSLANLEAITLDSTLGFSGTTLKCTTATSSQLGCVKPDGTIITISGGAITVAKATNAAYGAMEGDGSTVSCTAGVCSAIGGTATTIDARGSSGATTINNGNPGYALTQTASGSYIANNQLFSAAGGYINKFRNGTFDVWQRGTGATSIGTSGNYFADGWKVYFTGSTSVTALQATGPGAGQPLYSLEIEGATSNTDIKVGQRIESYVAAPLAGQTVTVQFWYYQNTGSTVTPNFSTCYASAQDNFGTCTGDVSSTSLTACATATWCQEAYTFTASSSAGNGYEVDLDCNAGFTSISVNCRFAAADIRVTPGVSTGVNTNPPPPELRPIGVELLLSQRYLRAFNSGGANQYMLLGQCYSTTACIILLEFSPPTRVPVTGIVSTSVSNFAVLNAVGGNVTATAFSLTNESIYGADLNVTVAGGLVAGNATQFGMVGSNGQQILFTGAEL